MEDNPREVERASLTKTRTSRGREGEWVEVSLGKLGLEPILKAAGGKNAVPYDCPIEARRFAVGAVQSVNDPLKCMGLKLEPSLAKTPKWFK
ncbi:hypothetical protein AVEN_135005-1 [Araneus ventricosus]|uniref:Uncharacterized protein n=1 Tax=Araneus ventricosus TaxID=182803 RepID=A0A4Y2G5V9_ARAVE|nr:hypothetical protein AVEN_135005-1 [Araneus ventricosus]